MCAALYFIDNITVCACRRKILQFINCYTWLTVQYHGPLWLLYHSFPYQVGMLMSDHGSNIIGDSLVAEFTLLVIFSHPITQLNIGFCAYDT